MNRSTPRYYEFGPFRLDCERRLLLRDGSAVSLPPKTLETLLALLERHGQVVSTETLMARLWPDSTVEDGNLTFNIHRLRRALGDQRREHRYIVTIPRTGYLFVAPVQEAGIVERPLPTTADLWPVALSHSFSFTLTSQARYINFQLRATCGL